MKIKKINLSLLLFLFVTFSIAAQVDKNSDLYKTIMSKDSLLFNVGFNTCDVSQFENLLSEKLEFFHDKDGISNKQEFLQSLRNGLCGSPPEIFQARRVLVPGTTEIYALYQKEKLYGAIQVGVHQFYESVKKQKEVFGSTAKFTHVWLLENGVWKLTKSLSYDHQTKLDEAKKIRHNNKVNK